MGIPDETPMTARVAGGGDMRVRVRPLRVCNVDEVLDIEREVFATPWTRAMFEAELSSNPFCRLYGAWRVDGDGDVDGGDGDGVDGVDNVDGVDGDGDVAAADQSPLLGYLCYWVVFEEVRLMNVAVRPAYRRRGVARCLVRRALRDGLAHGAPLAFLEVRAGNDAACALYQAMGFSRYGLRRAYYTNPVDDAILMRRVEQGARHPASSVTVSTKGASPC